MDEREGREVLARCFAEAGLSIQADVPIDTAQGRVVLDGYDPDRRIGYEFITAEAGDRDEVRPEVIAELEARMTRGELFVLLVDELDVGGADDLALAARRFLDAVRKRGALA